ncbi:uncharacterized protein LOC129569305 [Sitodiplosis mosellana]|uniref:uncharacterized protein LOC129569305 n=1 Tax=Sitodiplosis mosellana TaxID=263140 RepID=UPI002443D64A|nr:uncharacterized protein LOC129569305 [Sitodiplosis mosellana]
MSATLIFVSLLATLVATAYLYVKNSYSYWKRRGIPYKTPSFPFGNFPKTFMSKKCLGEELQDIYNESAEPFIGVFTSIQPALLVRDPKIIKDIMIKEFQSFGHRGINANVDVDPMANNILLQTDEKWKRARAQFSPAFTSGKLKGIFNTIVDCGKSLDKYVDRFANTDKSVEMRELFARFATNVIVSVAFGLDIDCIENPDNEFRKHGEEIFRPCLKNMLRLNLAIMTPTLAKLFKIRFADKETGDFMIDAVRQNIEYREQNNVSRKDFFQLLMQLRNTGKIEDNDDDWTAKSTSDRKEITIEEMAAHAFLFFAGGFESSSSTMSFCMYELAKHPETQQKVYDEIVSVLEKHDGHLTYEAVADMKYIGQCLDESLRLHPPFPTSGRECTKDFKIPDSNVVIEKGTTILLSPLGLQYDPKYYEEPRKFKPERYNQSETANKSFEEMPDLVFGLGPRNCLGMRLGLLQSKIALILLLQKFKFELDERHKNTELKMNPTSTVLNPMGGLNLKASRNKLANDRMSALLIAVSLLAILIVTAYLYVKSAFDHWRRKGVPFKEPVFPFGNFANSFLQKKQFGEVVADLYNGTSEPYLGIYAGFQPGLLVRDPKLIKDICIKNFHSFDQRVFQVNVEADPMADNLLLQNGEKWKRMRTQFTPAFSSGKLKGMFDTIVACGNSLDKHIGKFADTNKAVEIRDVFARFATNVIASVAFGIDIDCIENPENEFRKYGQKIFKPSLRNILRANINVIMPKVSKWLGLRFVDKEIGDFMIETVRQNLEYREKNNVTRKDFFQLLMQLRNTGKVQEDDDWSAKADSNKKSLTIEELAAQAFLFFGGGFESSSSTMSFCMYELAKSPEKQQKAYEEITKILEQHEGQLTYDAVADMKYVDCCLDESLRLHPPFPIGTRKCTKNFNIPDTDIIIEKGTSIFFPTLGLQYDEKYYEEAEKFKPERYYDQQKTSRNFEEMPDLVFGLGSRNCIGMRLGKLQSKIAIVLLLRKFKFDLDDQHKNIELKLNPRSIVLAPMNGLNLKVYSR